MPDNLNTMISFTPEEKAYMDSAGNANPYPAEKPAEPAPEAEQEPAKETAEAEPEQQAEAEPEKDADEGDEVEVVNKEGETRRKMIAYGAYEKQRREAKAAKEQLSKLNQELAYLRGLSQSQQQPSQVQQPQAAQDQEISLTPPDKAKEPEKYLAWLEQAASRALHTERQAKAQSQQSAQIQQLNEAVYAHEQAFVAGDPENGVDPHPDFNEAVKFLQDKHSAELREAGYEPHEIQQIMAVRAQSLAIKALQAGKSPAERAYNLAKLNGYKKAAPTAPKETEAEKIARQAQKQEKAGKTISALSGGESKGLTPEALANMDPKEFQKLWDKGEAKAVIGWVD